MTSRFSLRARVAVSALLLAWSANAGTAFAQGTATPEPSATPKPRQGFLRFWNLSPKTGGESYELVPAADPTGKAFQIATASNYGADYNPVTPGRYVLNLYRSGTRDKPIKTFDVALQDKDYASIVVHPGADPGTPPEAEYSLDMPDPNLPLDNRLTVRQCLLNSKVIVAVSRTQMTDALNFGATYTFKDLPKGAVPIGLSIAIGGRTERFSTEADFTYVHRTTLLIIKDAYGRLRPRVVADGPSSAPEPTPPPAPSVAKSTASPSASPVSTAASISPTATPNRPSR